MTDLPTLDREGTVRVDAGPGPKPRNMGEHIVQLNEQLARVTEERDALFEEAKTFQMELDARDGSHWAMIYQSLERWRMERETVARLTAELKAVA